MMKTNSKRMSIISDTNEQKLPSDGPTASHQSFHDEVINSCKGKISVVSFFLVYILCRSYK